MSATDAAPEPQPAENPDPTGAQPSLDKTGRVDWTKVLGHHEPTPAGRVAPSTPTTVHASTSGGTIPPGGASAIAREADRVRQANVRLRAAIIDATDGGMSLRAVAEATAGLFSHETVRRLLHNEIQQGYVDQGARVGTGASHGRFSTRAAAEAAKQAEAFPAYWTVQPFRRDGVQYGWMLGYRRARPQARKPCPGCGKPATEGRRCPACARRDRRARMSPAQREAVRAADRDRKQRQKERRVIEPSSRTLDTRRRML